MQEHSCRPFIDVPASNGNEWQEAESPSVSENLRATGPEVVAFRKRDLRSYRLQEALIGRAARAAIGEEIELTVSRLNQNQPHPHAAFDAGHLGRRLKARTRGRRSGKVQH